MNAVIPGAGTNTLSHLPAGGATMRSARAAVFAASSVALASAAHRAGGGTAPTPGVLTAAVAVLVGFGLVWSGRERRGPAITATVLASQLALHAVFALAPMTSMTRGGGNSELNRWAAMLLCHDAAHPATAAQVNAARAALGLGPLSTTTSMHMAGPLTSSGAGMLALHLIAALVMAWWLRRGERAAWATARRVVGAVLAAHRGHRLPVSTAVLRAIGAVWVPRRSMWGTGLAGRGPPQGRCPVLTA